MVRDNDMLINLRNLVDIIEHPTQNRVLTYLQQWLWEILCQLPQPRGISCRNNNILHSKSVFVKQNALQSYELITKHQH